MEIQVLSTSVQTKQGPRSSYQELEVAYKNLSFNGKVESKKLMSFGANAEAFKTLSAASAASVWSVEVVKNDKGYNDWVKVDRSAAPVPAVGASSEQTQTNVRAGSTSGTKAGGWETPEERAKKQIYIVRQSSISAAVNALSVGQKTPPKAVEVIEYARELENYVFESDVLATVTEADVKKLDGFEDSLDVPF